MSLSSGKNPEMSFSIVSGSILPVLGLALLYKLFKERSEGAPLEHLL